MFVLDNVPTFNLKELSFRVSFMYMYHLTFELHLETLGSRML